MPSDIQSVRVTTEVLADKEGEEPTLAVHVIVDRSVPVLGWVLMVSALFGCAAMVSSVIVGLVGCRFLVVCDWSVSIYLFCDWSVSINFVM